MLPGVFIKFMNFKVVQIFVINCTVMAQHVCDIRGH